MIWLAEGCVLVAMIVAYAAWAVLGDGLIAGALP